MSAGASDEELMLAYRAGDAGAFDLLYSRHKGGVFRYLRRQTGNTGHAEELFQDVWLRLIDARSRYEPQAKFTTWLYTIARNLCVDQSRRAKHRKAQSLDAPLGSSPESATLLDVLPADQMATDRKTINRELHLRLHAAIARLGEEQREVFLMREFLDMQFKEIAVVVGCPENTVKSRMRYALEKLREELNEYADLAKAVP